MSLKVLKGSLGDLPPIYYLPPTIYYLLYIVWSGGAGRVNGGHSSGSHDGDGEHYGDPDNSQVRSTQRGQTAPDSHSQMSRATVIHWSNAASHMSNSFDTRRTLGPAGPSIHHIGRQFCVQPHTCRQFCIEPISAVLGSSFSVT